MLPAIASVLRSWAIPFAGIPIECQCFSAPSPRSRGEGLHRSGTTDPVDCRRRPPHPESALCAASDLSPQAGRGGSALRPFLPGRPAVFAVIYRKITTGGAYSPQESSTAASQNSGPAPLIPEAPAPGGGISDLLYSINL